jgi:cytidyltransferase-like protein
MDTVVIYPGRFHPFHKGHKSVYDTLVRRFGKNRVFIATSNKVDPPKSPFTFEEKRAMIALTGIDPSRVIQVKNPYQATEITDNYDPQNTIALFAVSDKDMAEDPRFSFKPRKDGNPSYYQPAQKDMQGFDKHGYIITVPTLQFNVLGKPMRSASEFRANFARADADTQKQMVNDLFGKYDSKVHNIMTQKINETLIRADEILDKLIEMGADDHYILEACRRVDTLVESIQVNELKGNARLIRSPEEIDKRLTFIKPVKGLSNLISPKKPTKTMRRRAYSQMPEEITNFNNEDPMSSVIAIRGIGTMTIPQALDKVAEMSNMIAEIAKSNDAKNIQDNVPYYMNLLKTYNESIQEAYSELAQQRRRGGTKSRGIDPDITEGK